VRAYQREEAWAPAYVADDLAAAEQRAARARTHAELWAAQAEVALDPEAAGCFRKAAAHARAEAEEADRQIADLQVADEARAAWYTHTAASREKAERARATLGARGVDLDAPDEQVTAGEWLAADRADRLAEDDHREITEADLYDETLQVQDAEDATVVPAAVETAVPDVRDTSTPDLREHTDADRGRVLSHDETAIAIARAQVALAEIAARQHLDEQTVEQDRREQLARWAEDDRAAEEAAEAQRDDLAMEW
jgi:hypothetical protein